jgi:DNA-binding transcriptional LysR family regulator
MSTSLPTELLRTFVEVVDAGSMLKASERVFLTPSAVSLQIKRLEEIVNAPLFYRDKRKLTITTAGETLLGFAEDILALNDQAINVLAGERASGPIRVGMVEDFARTVLVGSLKRFSQLNPDAQLHLRVCGSLELRELIDVGRIDIALCMRLPSEDHVIATRAVHWFGDETLLERPVLPLAMLEAPCLFRAQALAALEDSGVAHEIAIETASTSALHAAVVSGLGVTSRTAGFMAPDQQGLRISTLPMLPPIGYCLLQSATAAPSSAALKSILLQAVEQM